LYPSEYDKVKEVLLEIRNLPENYVIGIHHTNKYAIEGITNNGLKIYEKDYEIGSGKITLENSVKKLGTTKHQGSSKQNIPDEEYLKFIDDVFSEICTDTIYGSSSIITITPLSGKVLSNKFYEKNTPYKVLLREFFILTITVDGEFSFNQAKMKVKNCTIPDFQQKANEKLNKMKIAQLTELRNLVVLSNIEEEKKGKRPY
ncbi:MAG: hypothetical protein K2I70_02730, partial [Bacilli bacterium]|nr:hypothetical protein [Bacilli bacterium]